MNLVGLLRTTQFVLLTKAKSEELLGISSLPSSAEIAIPVPCEEVFHLPRRYVVLYEYPFLIGLRFPFTPLAKSFIEVLNLSPGQLMSQIW